MQSKKRINKPICWKTILFNFWVYKIWKKKWLYLFCWLKLTNLQKKKLILGETPVCHGDKSKTFFMTWQFYTVRMTNCYLSEWFVQLKARNYPGSTQFIILIRRGSFKRCLFFSYFSKHYKLNDTRRLNWPVPIRCLFSVCFPWQNATFSSQLFKLWKNFVPSIRANPLAMIVYSSSWETLPRRLLGIPLILDLTPLRYTWSMVTQNCSIKFSTSKKFSSFHK